MHKSEVLIAALMY